MSWDTFLKEDVKCAADRHLMNTADFEEDNPLKFSFSTPKRGARAFMRVLQGVPSSGPIVHDIMKVMGCMVLVQAKLAFLVQGVGNRNGGVRHQSVGLRLSPETHQAREKAARLIMGPNGRMHICAGSAGSEVGGFQGRC